MSTLIYIASLMVIVSSAFSQKERKYIRSGNNDYNEGKYEDSELSYRKAIENHTDSTDGYKATFNLGDALFKQEKYPEAINQFNVLANQQSNKEDKAKIYHNLGNSYLVSGELEKSIDAYKNALRNNPSDKETKYNLAYAQKMLQQQQQQQNQEQQQQNQEQQEQQQQQQQDQQDKQDQEQQSQPQEQKMSKEEAEQMLQAVDKDDKDVQEKLKKIQKQYTKVKNEKDW